MNHILKSVLAVTAMVVATTAAQAQDFPLTIQHAYGDTVIPAKPQRIVTWGWASQDAVLALGEVPVGIPHFAYGGDENGALGWDKDAVAALGAEFPTILPAGREVPVEAIAALQPDLILAVYSGLSAEEYKILSGIAPVVAYPTEAWSTSWQDVITITGMAMGKADEATALVAELEQFIIDETAKYPQLAGASFAAISEYNGQIDVYADNDSRVTFLTDAGLVSAPSVAELAQREGLNYSVFSLSYETFDDLEADLFVAYFETLESKAAFFDNPIIALHKQVESGAVASVVGAELINSISPPSALSLKWGYAQYIKLIADAATAGGR